MKTKLVTLMKEATSSAWSNSRVGEVFEVIGHDKGYYAVVENGIITNKLLHRKECENK